MFRTTLGRGVAAGAAAYATLAAMDCGGPP